MPKVQAKLAFELPTPENPVKVFHGNNIDILRSMPSNSIDSVVTDPPYGLGKEPNALEMLRDWTESGHHDVKGRGFMGKEWDAFVPQPIFWRECLRVLKPGAHLLSFAGTRTHDLMALGLRIAGFEIRDCVAWVYGSGFPKSLDVSKAIDKESGVEGGRGPMKRGGERLLRQTDNGSRDGGGMWGDEVGRSAFTYAPATDAARQWQGWGTALKPAYEPVIVARKPLIGTVAENVLAWGTGALNIDGCRVGTEERFNGPARSRIGTFNCSPGSGTDYEGEHVTGRWPANLIHDGSEKVVSVFPADGSGSAARFFYSPKVGKEEREFGMGEFDASSAGEVTSRKDGSQGLNSPRAGAGRTTGSRNVHPTVKPVDLMRYLCRLVTPPGGIVLDPFAGSGTTGIAATIEKFRAILIEREDQYSEICRARVGAAKPMGNGDLWETVASVNGKGR